MKGRRGFTLVEIMIVVAIVAIALAIAIPNLLRARLNAQETAAIQALQTLSAAMESFRAAQTPPDYPAALSDLTLPTSNPAYIDQSLANATSGAAARQGYWYQYQRVSTDRYSIWAEPAARGTTGNRGFFLDQTGVIRTNPNGQAGPGSPELQ